VPEAISFYFNYRIGAGGPNKNSVNENYTLGTNCGGGVPNDNPTVSLTSPLTTDVFTSPATVTISATASDTDGTVSKVEFFSGTTKLGEATSTPYTLEWTNVQPGTYSITARATDDKFGSTTSAPVSITVGGVSTIAWCGSGSGAGH